MKLKTVVVLGSLLVGSGSVIARAATPLQAEAATHEIRADVIAVDAEKKTLTMKDDAGDKTLPVEGKAVAVLSEVKPGAKVILTCTHDEAKTPKAIVDIKLVAADQ